MNPELEQLKKLVLEGGFDSESISNVLNLEYRLQSAISSEKLSLHPAIVEYISYLTQEIDRCKVLLSEQDNLTERERITLYERKAQARKFLDVFNPDKTGIEAEIKQMLDVAISKQ